MRSSIPLINLGMFAILCVFLSVMFVCMTWSETAKPEEPKKDPQEFAEILTETSDGLGPSYSVRVFYHNGNNCYLYRYAGNGSISCVRLTR